ncbi:TPA: O-antigen polysaccharide polymerase Wzy [Vibrio vulnificus]|nr:O-antigen polysaccharide polymerase Wzy [Vibrio vulnificus]HDY7748131.1 O-antigen polysaccharide polymerase Wzy [Vibrio vulnificus]HDY7756440.1 O-antigen polysaccharide polymerase Wzy [Vibrio vulnificus]HDY7760857.1 O-antigen polysaccharide polymerase Wzy [Vibrio vulnificus]HDY7769980.1 O-antigen polysaccharide polymerase Wzy [Vibrio vulnificus]
MSKVKFIFDYFLFFCAFCIFYLDYVEVLQAPLLLSFSFLTLVYFSSIKNALSYGGTNSLFFIFLSCFFIFILGGRYFNYSNVNYTSTVFGLYYISDSVLVLSFNFYALVLSIINISHSTSNLIFKKEINSKVGFSPLLFDVGRFLFIIFLPGTILKFYMEFKFIMSFGYYAYYSEGVSAPFWIDVSRYLFVIAFAILISSLPAWKSVRFYFFVFVLFAFGFLLLGVRSSFVLYISLLYYIYYNFYSNRTPKITTLLLLVCALISLLLFVQFYRQGWYFDLKNGNLVSYFFTSQSNSFYILPFTINNLEYFTSNFSVFSPLSPKALIFRSQNIERLNEIGLLGDVISYKILGEELFNKGMGLGGNFVAELYQSGIFITLLLASGLGGFLAYFQNRVISSRYLILISIVIVSNMAYISRSSLFRNFNLLFILTFLFVILLFVHFSVKRYRQYEATKKSA